MDQNPKSGGLRSRGGSSSGASGGDRTRAGTVHSAHSGDGVRGSDPHKRSVTSEGSAAGGESGCLGGGTNGNAEKTNKTLQQVEDHRILLSLKLYGFEKPTKLQAHTVPAIVSSIRSLREGKACVVVQGKILRYCGAGKSVRRRGAG